LKLDRIENWRSGDVEAKTLRSGRHRLSRTEVLASQRGRIMRAALDELGELGAGGLTVGGVVERAKVSKKTFYENFEGLDECVVESLETVHLVVGAEIAEAAANADLEAHFAKLRAMIDELAAAAADEPVVATAIVASGFGLGEPKSNAWLFFNTARQRIMVAYFLDERRLTPDLAEPEDWDIAAAVGFLELWLVRSLAEGHHRRLPDEAGAVFSKVVAILSQGRFRPAGRG